MFDDVPSPCATCAEVRPLVDEALEHLASMKTAYGHATTSVETYTSLKQALLTLRRLVAVGQEMHGDA